MRGEELPAKPPPVAPKVEEKAAPEAEAQAKPPVTGEQPQVA